MKGQAIWLLRAEAALNGAQIVERVDRLGLHKKEPISGAFRAWGTTVESAGESWDTTPERLFGQLRETRREIAFQLWLGLGATLVSAQYLRHQLAITFRFDGWNPAEAELLVARAFWAALNHELSVGFVVDFTLPETREEWAAFLSGESTVAPTTAALVWLRSFHSQPLLRVNPDLWHSAK